MANEKPNCAALAPTALVQALDAFAHSAGMVRNEYVKNHDGETYPVIPITYTSEMRLCDLPN